ncbi:MAG: anion transporter [Deltaproteobacteria bacterium]|nr:anion transporter [Deltaproteobacteria bacterium]
MEISFWFSTLVIIITIIGVSLGRYPFLRMNRATIAFVGAVVLIVFKSISIEQAYDAVDLNTVALLLLIMILNVNFRLSGFFYLISGYIMKFAQTPGKLLALLVFFSGFLSALFLNDTIVLVFTPIILEITMALKRNPVPYLIALATSANIGSVATIIGNPQNIIIGTFSGISFGEFALYLVPVAFAGLIITWMVIVMMYRNEFRHVELRVARMPKYRIYRPLLKKSVVSAVIMFLAFVLGCPVTIAAMGAAAVLLITRRIKSERVFNEIDWSLLVFFSGLFIVTKTTEVVGLSDHVINVLKFKSGSEVVDLTILSAVSSNLISNVPAVLLLKNVIESFSNVKIAWLTMAMATTFAGNLTLLGSVANLIVAESARKHGVRLSFTEYFRSGSIITLITLALGVLWLSLFMQ